MKTPSSSQSSLTTALLWIHKSNRTGLPIRIDALEWSGIVSLLEYVTDLENIVDISVEVPLEKWVTAKIEYLSGDGLFHSVRILPYQKNV